MGRDYPAHPLVGVGAIILDANRVVLVRRGRPPALGQWSLPGGIVELGETMEEAIVREGYNTKAEARAAMDQVRAEIKSQRTSAAEPKEWDFVSLMTEYLEQAQRRFATKTWKYKRYVYQSFMDFAGNLPLSQVTPHLIESYLGTRHSNYNYNVHRKDLCALINWGWKRGVIKENPFLHVAKMPVEESNRTHFTTDEMARLLMAAGPDRPFFIVLYHTMARVGEIFSCSSGIVLTLLSISCAAIVQTRKL